MMHGLANFKFNLPLGKYVTDVLLNYGGKGKAIPLQAWTCPEGSKRLRLPDFKTIGK
jgi:hypothetical protein